MSNRFIITIDIKKSRIFQKSKKIYFNYVIYLKSKRIFGNDWPHQIVKNLTLCTINFFITSLNSWSVLFFSSFFLLFVLDQKRTRWHVLFTKKRRITLIFSTINWELFKLYKQLLKFKKKIGNVISKFVDTANTFMRK